LGGDISRYLATKKGGVASDFFLWRQKKGGGGGDLFGDFVLWRIFAILQKIFFKRIFGCKMPCCFFEKNSNFFPKIATVDSYMKGCLRFSTFIFSIFSNLAKYTYGLLPLKQPQKIGKKRKKKKKRHTWGNMDPFWEKAAKKSPYSNEKIAQFAIFRQ